MVVIVSQVLRILSHLLLLVTQLAREPVTELPLRYSSGGVFFILVFHPNFLITREEHSHLHPNFQEEHPPAGGSDGPTHNPGGLPPPPLCQQEQHTQDPGM